MEKTEAKRMRMRERLLAAACLHALLAMPALAYAADKHPATPTDQECVECHAEQGEVWLSGKHGLMNVKCVVCHGDPESNFVSQPTMVRCRGYHGDQVQDVELRRAVSEQSCFLCHDNHTVAPTAAAMAKHQGFHQGGAK